MHSLTRRRARSAAAPATAGVIAGCVFVMLLASAPAALAAASQRAAAAPLIRGAPRDHVPVATSRKTLALVLPLAGRLAALARFSAAITNPQLPGYAEYRSIRWLSEHFGATATAKARVVRYLRAHGATHVRVDATGLFVDASMRARAAERVFSTSLTQMRSDTRSGSDSYSLPAAPAVIPAALHGAVTGVVGLDTQPIAATPQLTRPTVVSQAAPLVSAAAGQGSGYEPVSGTPAGCPRGLEAGGFTPSQYLTAYGLQSLHAIKALGQGERVALIEIDGFLRKDVNAFARCFRLHAPKIVSFGVGIDTALMPGGEATLDLELLDAAAPELRSVDVYESDSTAAAVLQALTAPLQNSRYRPQVISASIGLCEPQIRRAVGHVGIANAEAALQMAADSGTSLVAASGDDGSAGCVAPNSLIGLPERHLAVDYPASSPWATGVGGTNLTLTAQNAIESQTVWNDGTALEQGGGGIGAGGGGLSSLFTRPGYQTSTVFQNHRAVPDLALLADISPGYDLYCTALLDCASAAHPWQTVGGTSAGAPLAAGAFALIDELLRLRRQQGLGLANPLLYEIGSDPTRAAEVLDPVTSGSNDVGPFIDPRSSPLGCCTAGARYNEAAGWGAVNFDALATAALAAQPAIAGVTLRLPPHQRPVAARHIEAIVTCTSSCDLSATARVRIGHSRPFTVHGHVYHLGHAGSRRIAIAPSAGQLSRLRAALRSHTRITAAVTGAIVDAGGNDERQTAKQRLPIAR